MKMTTTRANDRITDLSEALDLIATQLKWLIEKANAVTVVVGSPEGKEHALRFLQLHRDFTKVKGNIIDLCDEMETAEFDDPLLNKIYKRACHLLLRKCYEGLFKDFTHVVEKGTPPPQ